LEVFKTALNTFGFEPMIYISPRYSSLGAVMAALVALSNSAEAMAYMDLPDGYTFNQALQSRGVDGDFANLGDGVKLLYPNFLVSNPDYVPGVFDENEQFLNIPMSAYMAGVRSRTDIELGWHWSSSNQQVFGVDGMDVPLTFGLGDPNSEVQLLNAVGITTGVSMFGRGIREWGNYGAGFPGNVNMDAFECVRRTRAIMKRSLERACVPFLGRPINQANIDSILETVQSYLDHLVAQDRLIFGKCFFRAENNPSSQIQQGHLQFDIEYTPCAPMQRLPFTYKIDLSQLQNLL
jgi:hypothetical protein